MTQNGQMEKPSYYAVLPANVRYDERLRPNAKLLYAEITALCNKDGRCWATNNYFANLYKLHKKTISELVSTLEKLGYLKVTIEFVEGTKNISKRYLEIIEQPIHNYVDRVEKSGGGIHKNMDHYPIHKNTDQNTTRVNITRFNKPTIDELIIYKEEKQLKSDVDKFFNYHESKGWMVGKVKMKSWKKALLYWESNHKEWSEKDAKRQSDRSTYASSFYDYDKATNI